MGIWGKVVEMVFVLCSLLLAGFSGGAFCESYDSSANVDCLAEPLAPQYGGGLVRNPNFDSGLAQWIVFGSGKIMTRKSETGNNYLVAYDRKLANDSFSQAFDLKKDVLYTFSAWLQLSEGKEIVWAFLKTPDENRLVAGSVIAKSGCWSMLKGGFTVDEDITAHLYVSNNISTVEIWIDGVSLKGFTKAEWREHQNQNIEQVRKRNISIHVSRDGRGLPGANITITQIRPDFVIGGGTTASIANNKAYQDWFVQRFQAATFNNEMKWYYTERTPGIENYTDPDAMVSFFKKHGIGIRGHTILWANPNMTQSWVRALPAEQIRQVSERHLKSVVVRYSTDVIAWDVMNENMHFSYFEDILGPNASATFYRMVRSLDPEHPLFLNEFNTLEYPMDLKATPTRYLEMIHKVKSFPGNQDIPLGIGLQGHFVLKPQLSYIRSALDTLGATGFPIWLTELDTKRGPNQTVELEEVMREAFTHPAVRGIIVWGGWKPTNCNETCLADTNHDKLPTGCAEMCLVDNEMKNLPPGDVVDRLLAEWRTGNLTGVTNQDGVVEQTVFLGEYSVEYAHPWICHPAQKIFNVTKGEGTLELDIHV